jgi:peptide/nickel transport system substrate-binding protein/microcin C transport system substrate-binding protein
MRPWFFKFIAMLVLGLSSVMAAAPPATPAWVHAIAAFGQPKYGADFSHFDYLNPQAPKGGTLYLSNPDQRTSFDKFNYFTVKGNAPAGIALFMLEPLAVLSADEPQTMYGLLAQAMLVAPDKSSITFRLNPAARFSDGDPVLAVDVKYSFDMLSGKRVAPAWSTALAGVKQAVIVNERTIRFDLIEKNTDTLFKLGALRVFSHKWGLQADGTHQAFDDIVSEYPLTSGPYTIDVADSGRRIEFKRNLSYWARDLPVRRGQFNFDRVVYRYYQDEDVSTEAFKAGEFDLVKVYAVSIWMRRHRGTQWDEGRIVNRVIPLGTGQGLQSFQLNLRRPLFQDIRVRQALGLSYDFETMNRYHLLKRASSVFNNSDFAATALPGPGELKLLEPFRAVLPKEVFGPAYVAPRTDSDVHALRRNLLQARELLAAAGWTLASDGVLRNGKGEAFEFENLSPSGQDNEARMNAWRRNLDKLGIVMKDRKVDYALYLRRVEEFDFDMTLVVENTFALPSPTDYVSTYGAKAADEKGSNNLRGVKSPAVDKILIAMSSATSMADFRDASRALDRVVMWNHWQVPELYSDQELISHWDKFGMPSSPPKYFSTDLPFDLDPQIAWPLTAWWIKAGAARGRK